MQDALAQPLEQYVPPARKKATGRPFVKGDPRIKLGPKAQSSRHIPDILRKIGRSNIPAEMARKLPEQFPPAWKRNATWLETVMRLTYMRAAAGEQWAVQFIADRTEGKVKDTLALEGGKTLEVVEEIVDAPGAVAVTSMVVRDEAQPCPP